ncbi:MAG TPA: hypothetical protein VFQ45_01450 [Longimicrobium sp.]|nr:hypothetical protein [Longimicrobium sp.]
MRLRPLVLAALVCAASTLHAQEPAPPAGWTVSRWSTGGDSSVSFVEMAPGWHVTTGARAVLYDSATSASGNYALEAELFLFPGSAGEHYGIFVGGQRYGRWVPRYLHLAIDRAGGVFVYEVYGDKIVEHVNTARHEAVAAHTGGEGPVKNVLRIEVNAAAVRFLVNGQEVKSVPRAMFEPVELEGLVGLWVGAGMNLHVSRFDLTRHLAPQPAASH